MYLYKYIYIYAYIINLHCFIPNQTCRQRRLFLHLRQLLWDSHGRKTTRTPTAQKVAQTHGGATNQPAQLVVEDG